VLQVPSGSAEAVAVSGGDVVVAGLVVVVVTGGVVGAGDVDVAVDGAVAVPVVAGAAGDVLVTGESCVGVGVDRLVAVGPVDLDDDGAAVRVPRLVPGSLWPAELPGMEAVVAALAWLADVPGPPPLLGPFAVGAFALDSSMATTAMTPQVATAMPANRKPRVRRRPEPRIRSASF
jgi:hypothetical protein